MVENETSAMIAKEWQVWQRELSALRTIRKWRFSTRQAAEAYVLRQCPDRNFLYEVHEGTKAFESTNPNPFL